MTQGSLDPFRPWVEHPLACADTETDGVNPEEARIVTAYVATIDGSTVVPNHWVLDTGREMPEGAAKVHGYTTERMRAEGSNYEEGVMSIWAALSLAWADGRCVASVLRMIIAAKELFSISPKRCRPSSRCR